MYTIASAVSATVSGWSLPSTVIIKKVLPSATLSDPRSTRWLDKKLPYPKNATWLHVLYQTCSTPMATSILIHASPTPPCTLTPKPSSHRRIVLIPDPSGNCSQLGNRQRTCWHNTKSCNSLWINCVAFIG